MVKAKKNIHEWVIAPVSLLPAPLSILARTFSTASPATYSYPSSSTLPSASSSRSSLSSKAQELGALLADDPVLRFDVVLDLAPELATPLRGVPPFLCGGVLVVAAERGETFLTLGAEGESLAFLFLARGVASS